MEKVLKSTRVFNTVKTKTIATIVAIISAVALPQLFHLFGIVTGSGSSVGETFLPMHLAIFMVGMLAGSTAGLVAGVSAPLISFALTGMPAIAMLPFMMIELAMYGVISGALSGVKMPSIAKLLAAQIGGRLVRAGAILLGFSLSLTQVNPAIILSSIRVGMPGLILQWVLIPVVMLFVNKRAENE